VDVDADGVAFCCPARCDEYEYEYEVEGEADGGDVLCDSLCVFDE
jgi:hypothetical protein